MVHLLKNSKTTLNVIVACIKTNLVYSTKCNQHSSASNIPDVMQP